MKNGLILLLVVALLGTGIWGTGQYQQNQQHNIYLENQFHRMFQDMMVDVEDIQVNLAKVMVTGTPRQNVMLFSDIMNLSYDAQEKLSQLPIDHGNVSRTQKFLSQVGDLSMAMARKNLEGKPLNDQEMETLEELHNYSNYLSQQLIELQNNISKNGVRIGELMDKANEKLDKANENMLSTSFINVEERMQEYPDLIYDGPFSEHLKRQKPRLNEKNISKDDIKKIGEDFIGDGLAYEANLMGEIYDSSIPVYLLELKPQGKNENHSITMAITMAGGHVMWMLNTKESSKEKISEKKGIDIAKDFLDKKGYRNMIPTYSIKYDGQILINFAYSENDIMIYPDLIKVKVGLDEGNILGYEAEGYLFNHHQRTFSPAKISVDEATNKISINAKVSSPRLTIIPTEGGTEVLCYEFKAQYKQDTFLIYVNAETGEEQKILQVIIKDDGVLML